MATPNYSYEKRQRELAKKRKKEEKLKRKVDGKPEDGSPDDAEVTPGDPGTGAAPVPSAGNGGSVG